MHSFNRMFDLNTLNSSLNIECIDFALESKGNIKISMNYKYIPTNK